MGNAERYIPLLGNAPRKRYNIEPFCLHITQNMDFQAYSSNISHETIGIDESTCYHSPLAEMKISRADNLSAVKALVPAL